MAGAIAASRATAPAAGVALAMPQCWQPTPAAPKGIVSTETPAPIRLRLSRERLGVFLALAKVERRPLEDVLAEHVAETAGRLLRTRHELHLDPYDQAVLAEYIDGLAERQEAWEALEEESAARAATTPAMRQAAAAADERERFAPPDLEEWDRTVPFGYTEVLLAVEG